MLLVNLHERNYYLLRSDGKSPIALFTGNWLNPQFEWRRDLDINHSLADVLSGQYLANFLIQKGELGKRF